MMLLKCFIQYGSKFGILNSGQRTGKDQFSFQSQRKAMPKNAQTMQRSSSLKLPLGQRATPCAQGPTQGDRVPGYLRDRVAHEKEMIKEDDIESKKGGHTMTCGMKGVVYSSTARRRAGRRGEGWAVRAHTHVCTHVCTVRIVMCAVCAHTRVYSPVCHVHSNVCRECVLCVLIYVVVCVFMCVCTVMCAVCANTPVYSRVCCVQSCVLCVHTHVPVCVFTCVLCARSRMQWARSVPPGCVCPGLESPGVQGVRTSERTWAISG